MQLIPRPVHGVLDYVGGLVLLASPWLFGYVNEQPVSADMAMFFGGGIVLYTALTNFELGIVRLLPFPVHLVLDCIMGVALIGAPFIFQTRGTAAVVFVIFGIIELIVAATTRGTGAHRGKPEFPSWT